MDSPKVTPITSNKSEGENFDQDDSEPSQRRNNRSLSDSNFERFFAFANEEDTLSKTLTTDSAENENEKLTQLEKEFNYFLMMDQQENLESEIERKKIPQVGRNLENMFKQEVPT